MGVGAVAEGPGALWESGRWQESHCEDAKRTYGAREIPATRAVGGERDVEVTCGVNS